MQDLFVFDITYVVELALGANTKVPIERMKWKTDGKLSMHQTPSCTLSSLSRTPYLSLSLFLFCYLSEVDLLTLFLQHNR